MPIRPEIDKKLDRLAGIVLKALAVLVSLFALFVLWRVFVADRFVIPSDSMFPTLQTGDRVIAGKLRFGARLYTDFDFEDGMELRCRRVKGLGQIRHNDILVFNFPINNGKISFKINYVYAKRCIALPGDSISIENSHYLNNHFNGCLGVEECQDALSGIPLEQIDSLVRNVIQPNDGERVWTVKDWGPVYVPAKGDTLIVDDSNRSLYSAILEYEGASAEDSVHVFRHDYYFMAGDNVLNSQDSRYWGFLPDDYIVGIVNAVLYSRDSFTNKITFKRTKRL